MMETTLMEMDVVANEKQSMGIFALTIQQKKTKGMMDGVDRPYFGEMLIKISLNFSQLSHMSCSFLELCFHSYY